MTLNLGLSFRAHTMLYAFIMLALHPHVQDTLISEIESTIGDRAPTYDDFPNLVYPLCVMLETLRLFPPVIGIPKSTVNGPQTLLGKYVIPKGWTVFIDAIGLHRSEKYWGVDAAEFKPSRFDGRGAERQVDEEQQNIGDTSPGGVNEKIRIPVRSAFVPFSEGSRSCLGTPLHHGPRMMKADVSGRKFAQVEFVACLVVLMQKWRVELPEGVTREQAWDAVNMSTSLITLVPAREISLVFRRRH